MEISPPQPDPSAAPRLAGPRGGAAGFFILSFGYVALRFLLLPFRTRLLTEWLSKDVYAGLNLAIMTLTLLATSLSLGSFEYLVRHLPGRSEREQAALLRLILLRLAAPVWILAGLVFAAIGFWDGGRMLAPADWGLLWAGFVLTSLLLHEVFYLLGRAEIFRMRLIQVFQTDLWFLALGLGGAGALATLTGSLSAWVGWLGLVALIGLRRLPWHAWRRAPAETVPLSAIIRFGLPLLPTICGEALFRLSDRYVLLACRDSVTLADYTLCANISMIVYVIGASLMDLVIPHLFAHRNRLRPASGAFVPGLEMRRLFSLMLRYALGLSLVAGAGMISLHRDVLAVLSGPAYRDAASLLPWTAGVPLFFLLSLVAGRGLVAMDRTRWLGGATLAAAGVNLALNLLGVPRYGAVGAALANTTSLALLTLALGRTLGWRRWIAADRLRPGRILGAGLTSAVWFAAVRYGLPAAGPWLRLTAAALGAAALLAAWGIVRREDARDLSPSLPPDEPAP